MVGEATGGDEDVLEGLEVGVLERGRGEGEKRVEFVAATSLRSYGRRLSSSEV